MKLQPRIAAAPIVARTAGNPNRPCHILPRRPGATTSRPVAQPFKAETRLSIIRSALDAADLARRAPPLRRLRCG